MHLENMNVMVCMLWTGAIPTDTDTNAYCMFFSTQKFMPPPFDGGRNMPIKEMIITRCYKSVKSLTDVARETVEILAGLYHNTL